MGNLRKKAERRLEARIRFWESIKNKQGYKKPGSKKYK
jgi:hypothetical protein